MSYETYSFGDVSAVVSHPNFGQRIATGEGLGSITTEMTTDRSIQDVAADGAIMVTKVKARNGTISISVQQTSSFHQWLIKLYNYLEATNTASWAGIKVIIRTPGMKELETCTGVSFTKLPSNPRQAQGQNITWSFMAADIQREVV
ncbi:MAG TPA: phage protein [Desulfosporosinus sp.]|nr:phage protein [Desulfosporosinus sp.]